MRVCGSMGAAAIGSDGVAGSEWQGRHRGAGRKKSIVIVTRVRKAIGCLEEADSVLCSVVYFECTTERYSMYPAPVQ